MFWQILIPHDDQKYQVLLWKWNSSGPIKVWLLQTVTYGMISSPFLTIRVIYQNASDEYDNGPLGAEILKLETYMDDTFSGGHSLQEASE